MKLNPIIKKNIKLFFWYMVMFGVIYSAILTATTWYFSKNLPSLDQLERMEEELNYPARIFDRNTPPNLLRTLTVEKRIYTRFDEIPRELIDALTEIAQARRVTATEVALSWLINFHGDTVVAIPGASKVRHVEQNVGAMRLTLSDAELARIDDLSKQFN